MYIHIYIYTHTPSTCHIYVLIYMTVRETESTITYLLYIFAKDAYISYIYIYIYIYILHVYVCTHIYTYNIIYIYIYAYLIYKYRWLFQEIGNYAIYKLHSDKTLLLNLFLVGFFPPSCEWSSQQLNNEPNSISHNNYLSMIGPPHTCCHIYSPYGHVVKQSFHKSRVQHQTHDHTSQRMQSLM